MNDISHIARLQRCLDVMLQIHAQRPRALPILERVLHELEQAEAELKGDIKSRARALISQSKRDLLK